MKQNKKMKSVVSLIIVVTLILMMFSAIGLTASATVSGDWRYNDLGNGTATIVGYDGEKKEVDIPSSLSGKKVTCIGRMAFYNQTSITKITIPSSVTSIDGQAFDGCSNLIAITIPDSVTSIDGAAFFGCSSLASIIIPDSVTRIGDCAFEGCSSLISIKMPDGITKIDESIFVNCTSLTTIKIPDSVTSICYRAFSGCSSLSTITIPDSVMKIDKSALLGTAIYNDDNNWDDGGLYINNCLVSVKKTTIKSNFSVKPGTRIIADALFLDCQGLVSITIPDSITSIADYAFKDCISLSTIKIPDRVSSIGESSFRNCPCLSAITIPNTVTKIGSGAFEYTAIYNDDNNWDDGGLYINNCLVAIKYETLKSNFSVKPGTRIIASGVLYNCNELITITILDSVTNIGDKAFVDCDNVVLLVSCTKKSYAYKYAIDHGIKYELNHNYVDQVDPQTGDTIQVCTICGDILNSVLYGDANDDGKIDSRDILIIKKYCVGILKTINFINADVNKDGKCNAIDILMIKKYIVGIIKNF